MVVVPDTPNPLNEIAYTIFRERISTVHRTDPWDTEPYLFALQQLDILMPNEQ